VTRCVSCASPHMISSAAGIVLSRRSAGENDLVARVLCVDGSILELRGFGMRASKRRSLTLFEPGSLIEFQYYSAGDGEASLKEGVVRERFEELKSAYAGAAALAHVLEATAQAARGEANADLYALLSGTLVELGSLAPVFGTRDAEGLLRLHALLVFFKARLLILLGVLADPRACSECGAELTEDAYWPAPEARFVCPACAPTANREDGWMALWSMRQGLRAPAALLELESRLELCLMEFSGRPLRSSLEFKRALAEDLDAFKAQD
jgi:DNA repair protein RecO